MPFQLKDYQRRCLDELAQYLRRVIAQAYPDHVTHRGNPRSRKGQGKWYTASRMGCRGPTY